MYSFLVAASLRDRRVLERARVITKQMTPTLQSILESRAAWFPEMNCGWFVNHTTQPLPKPFLTTFDDAGVAVLAYGEIYKTPDAAGAIHETYLSQGADAVRDLEGSFSTAIVDRRERKLFAISDPIGRRSMRYAVIGDTLLLAANDLPIVATGLIPLELDLVSAASSIGVGWSWSGASMLQGIHATPAAGGFLQWDGKLHPCERHYFQFTERIDAEDTKSQAELRTSMVERMRHSVALLMQGKQSASVDLTAGIDSRAIFSLACSALDRDKIHARTRPDVEGVDLYTARWLADCAEVRHSEKEIVLPHLRFFWENAQGRAFFTSGDETAQRAMSAAMRVGRFRGISLGGYAGEFFRGKYYATTEDEHLPRHAALGLLTQRFKQLHRLPFQQSRLVSRVASRLAQTCEEAQSLAKTGYDVLDLCYLWECFRFRTNMARLPNPYRYHLFENPQLARDVLRFPSPAGRACFLHAAVIKQCAPHLYSIPINGSTQLPGAAPPPKSFLAAIGTAAKTRDQRVGYAELFCRLLTDSLRDILLSPGSVALSLFGRTNLNSMIDDHLAGKQNFTLALGYLANFEVWWQQLYEARRLAIGSAEPSSAA